MKPRIKTRDFQTADRNTILAPINVGATRRLTPEGFLLCEGVAIGRTGEQIYRESDLPGLKGDMQGNIRVLRPPETVFDPQAMSSFEGKAVTLNHPSEFVGPATWKHVAIGTIHNVRRGIGTQDDLLIADLLITSTDAIVHVNKELPEISLGYDAEYQQTEPGIAVQRQIIGNHAAFVDKGRAGVRCAVKDEDTTVDKLKALLEAIRSALRTNDAAAAETATAALESALTQTKDAKTYDADIAALTAKVGDLFTQVAALTAAVKTADAASKPALFAADKLGDVQARVEVLAPGTKLPTGDAATVDVVEAAMQTALAAAEAKHPTEIKALLMGRTVKALTGDALLGTTVAASEIAKARNDAAQLTSGLKATKDAEVITPTILNATYSKFWNRAA